MTADYNGWADRPEDEREAEEAAEETYGLGLPAARASCRHGVPVTPAQARPPVPHNRAP